MNQLLDYLVFTLADKTFALPLTEVHRVVHATAITKLPKAPELVQGVVNYKGNVLPVLDMSKRFHLPVGELDLDRHFILVHLSAKTFILIADSITGVIRREKECVVEPDSIFPGVQLLVGVIKSDDGLVLIPDLENLLTNEEERILSNVVEHSKPKKSNKSKKKNV
jgi:purine-binding chemotaxis protein CheW